MGRPTRFAKISGVAFALLPLGLLVLSACSGSSNEAGPDRTTLAERIVERHGVDAETARCLTDFLFDEYDSATRTAVYDGGLPAIPEQVWGTYAYSLVACERDPTVAAQTSG